MKTKTLEFLVRVTLANDDDNAAEPDEEFVRRLGQQLIAEYDRKYAPKKSLRFEPYFSEDLRPDADYF